MVCVYGHLCFFWVNGGILLLSSFLINSNMMIMFMFIIQLYYLLDRACLFSFCLQLGNLIWNLLLLLLLYIYYLTTYIFYQIMFTYICYTYYREVIDIHVALMNIYVQLRPT